MRVELSYEERILNWFSANPQKRGEHFMTYDQRAFKATRAILQPLYDELNALRRDITTEEITP